MPLTTMYVDMNAYFASVEQHLRPELRGRPIAVCPYTGPTGCCIAASYEAKAKGVKTGCGVRDAKRLCPGIAIVEARPVEYVRFHHQVRAAIDRCAPIDAVRSIDEFAVRLWPGNGEQDPSVAAGIARSIKREIAAIGPTLRCSIGIAPNRFLAKVAADMHKPDGLTILQPHDLPGALYPLPLTDLPGIGENMHRRLIDYGIETTRDLCARSREQLVAAWGSIVGAAMWHDLRGDDLPAAATRRSTIGHSHVLAPELRTRSGVRAVLVKLLHRAAERARESQYAAEWCTVEIGFLASPPWHRRFYVGGQVCTTAILSTFGPLFDATAPRRGVPFHASATLHELVSATSATLPLFDGQVRDGQLAAAMDAVNNRFGPDTLYPGSMHTARESAPVRISFTQIPDMKAFGE